MTLGNGKLPEKVHLWEDFLEKIDEYIFDKEQIIFQKPQFNYNRLLFNESNETSHRKGSMSSTKWVNKRCQNSTKQAKKPRTNVWLYGHLEAFVHEETYAAICKKKQQNGLYKISWAELIKIAKEIHDRYIIHQNLYSKNILMDNGCALIVDFLLLYQKIFPATSSNEKEDILFRTNMSDFVKGKICYFELFSHEEWSLDHYYSWVHENYNVTEEANAHKFFYGIVYSINNDFVALEEVQTFTEKLLRRQKHDVKRANTGWKQARDKRVLCDMTNLPTAGRKRKNHDTNAMDIPSKRMK
ncbi:hypothetical protein C2G38_2302281, partial [Gigaspora rosea]